MNIDVYGLELKQVGTIECDTNDTYKRQNRYKIFASFGMHSFPEEHVVLITTDANHEATGIYDISHGTSEKSLLDIKGIMRRAVLSSATGIVIAHNHPTGSADPSDIDLELTQQLKYACNLMDLYLIDHMILAKRKGVYYSMRRERDMDEMYNAEFEEGFVDGITRAGVNMKKLYRYTEEIPLPRGWRDTPDEILLKANKYYPELMKLRKMAKKLEKEDS